MPSILIKTLVTLAVFLIVPVVTIMLNWQWEPESLNKTSEYLFWVTETAGMPWAILICGLFPIIFALCLKIKSKKQAIKLIIILAVAILLGQVIKSAIKSYTAESRPFVLWIEETYQVDDEYFYSLPRLERKEIIKQYISESPIIPNWLVRHWANETGYTFPSGHTLFSATWAFLALVLMNFKRNSVVITAIIAWAVIIEISRLALGMHHPLDVICGAIVAWGIALFSYYLAKKWHVIE